VFHCINVDFAADTLSVPLHSQLFTSVPLQGLTVETREGFVVLSSERY